MPIYWLNIDVKFTEPMPIEDEDGRTSTEKVHGYMQELGATYPEEEALKSAIASFVYQEMEAASVEINFEYIGIIALDDVQREIYEDKDIEPSLRSDPLNEGIWYRTGRGFYTNDE